MNQFRTRQKQPMASKMNILKLVQQAHGLAEVTWRCPVPGRPELLMMPAPSPQPTVGRRLTVSMDAQHVPDRPRAVRIIHLSQTVPDPVMVGQRRCE